MAWFFFASKNELRKKMSYHLEGLRWPAGPPCQRPWRRPRFGRWGRTFCCRSSNGGRSAWLCCTRNPSWLCSSRQPEKNRGRQHGKVGWLLRNRKKSMNSVRWMRHSWFGGEKMLLMIRQRSTSERPGCGPKSIIYWARSYAQNIHSSLIHWDFFSTNTCSFNRSYLV